MATREASIKVTLRAGAFTSGIRQMGSKVRSVAGVMGKDLGAGLKSGVNAAKASMKSMLSEMQGGLRTAATLGGAIGFGALIKGAVDAEQSNAKLAATIETFSGKAMRAKEVQDLLTRSVGKTKIAFTEARTSLNQLAGTFKPGGQLEDALTRASFQAQRLGVTGGVVARVYTRKLRS
jgi:hypothetical protein